MSLPLYLYIHIDFMEIPVAYFLTLYQISFFPDMNAVTSSSQKIVICFGIHFDLLWSPSFPIDLG
jgi:hypothetical protein